VIEGSVACGRPRSCTDVEDPRTTQCTCRNGKYDCGSCPHCNIDLHSPGCGIGQVCDGVTFTLCDGTKEEISVTCSCNFQSWNCAGDASGAHIHRCPDAGPVPTDAPLVDVPSGDGPSDLDATGADSGDAVVND
jgi:hypothetical protein